jgi:hypothetical protein
LLITNFPLFSGLGILTGTLYLLPNINYHRFYTMLGSVIKI